MKIEKTRNYDQFKTLGGNRSINEGHIRTLEKSIQKTNLLRANPIVVNAKMEMIDGQHRWVVAKRNDLELYFVVVAEGDIETVRMLNANQKQWAVETYINSYAKLGHKDYRKLIAFCESNSLALTIGASLLMPNLDADGNKSGKLNHRSEMPRTLRNGQFRITHYDEAQLFADRLKDYEAHAVENLIKNREFIDALYKVYTEHGIEHEVMIRNLEDSDKLLVKRGSVKDYLRDLEDVYNYRKSSGQLRFF